MKTKKKTSSIEIHVYPPIQKYELELETDKRQGQINSPTLTVRKCAEGWEKRRDLLITNVHIVAIINVI